VVNGGDFLTLFEEHVAGMTDAPREFHKWAGLSLLSTLFGQRVYWRKGVSSIYTNLYVLLLAPSGIGKSEVVRIAHSFAAGLELHVYPTRFSGESLQDELQENNEGLMALSEFDTLLSAIGKEYADGAAALLTDAWEGGIPSRARFRGRGNSTLPADLCINVLGASAVEWILGRTREDTFGSGFFPRFVLVTAWEPNGCYAFQPAEDRHRRQELLKMLNKLRETKGEVKFGNVLGMYARWYTEFGKKLNIPLFAAFRRRLTIAALKVAALLEISRTQSLTVSEASMHEACRMIEEIAAGMLKLNEDEFTFDHDSRNLKKVRDIIKAQGRMTVRELIRTTHMKQARITELLGTLKASDYVSVFDEPGQKGRSVKMVEWTEGLATKLDGVT